MMKKNKSRGSGHNVSLLGDELIECEILSRLPVKSLKRFRCVCKRWRSLIDQDKQFHDLHLTRSKTRPGLLILEDTISGDMRLLSAHLFEDRAVVVDKKITISTSLGWGNRTEMMSVNGLICFAYEEGILVYNVSTNEITPFIWLSIEEEEEEEEEEHKDDKTEILCSIDIGSGFGYDPTTKKHKVICICSPFRSTGEGKLTKLDDVCMVLTVGDNIWRRIEFPPHYLHGTSAHVNGVIYWLNYKGKHPRTGVLVAFDVGCEKFRVIHIPDFILNPPQGSNRLFVMDNLMELDGRLALLDRTNVGGKNNIIKMWIFDYDHDKEKSNSSNNWSKETISMPLFNSNGDYEVQDYPSIQAISGTDLIIVEPFESESPFCVYFYDRKKKTFEEIGITCTIVKDKPLEFWVMTYVESLFPVQ